MNVIKNLVSSSKYNIKCPYPMDAQFIVVHNTANDASAVNEIAYMISNNNKVSFHYAVDDKQIVQGIPENRNAWHAGDGANGQGNRKGIAVEICYSKSGGSRFIKAEKLAAKFIASKLKEKGWGIDKVKKHQDFSGKYCPHRTLDMGWQRFLNMVKAELDALNGSSNSTLYRVQTGAFKVKSNADKLAAELKKKGFDTYMVKVGGLYKVQVGAYSVKSNAENMMAKLKAKGFDAFITTESGTTATISTPVASLAVGDKVKLASGAPVYGTSKQFQPWVYSSTLYVREISGDRIVISTLKSGAVTGAVDKKYLTKI
jgi:N-acetylmuramoyl-L-alanine amidase CwlA